MPIFDWTTPSYDSYNTIQSGLQKSYFGFRSHQSSRVSPQAWTVPDQFLGNCPDDLDIPGIPQIQLPQRRFGVYHSSCPDMAAVIGILEKEIGTAPSQTSPSSKDATSGQGRGLLRWNLRRELGREVEKFSVWCVCKSCTCSVMIIHIIYIHIYMITIYVCYSHSFYNLVYASWFHLTPGLLRARSWKKVCFSGFLFSNPDIEIKI